MVLHWFKHSLCITTFFPGQITLTDRACITTNVLILESGATFSQKFQWIPVRASQLLGTWILIKAFPSFSCSYGNDKIFISVSQFIFQSPWAVLQFHMGVCPQLISSSPINQFSDRLSLNFILSFSIRHFWITPTTLPPFQPLMPSRYVQVLITLACGLAQLNVLQPVFFLTA